MSAGGMVNIPNKHTAVSVHESQRLFFALAKLCDQARVAGIREDPVASV